MPISSPINKKIIKTEYFSLFVDFEIENLKAMVSSVELNLNGLRDGIKTEIKEESPKQYNSEHDYLSRMDFLNDEIVQLKEIEDISKKLAAIGLYMIVENVTKRIFKWLYYDLDERTKENKIWDLYKWKKLKKELYKLCAFDLSDVSEYSVIDELRCLNNVIKHRDYVDKYLSVFFNWQNDLGKEIDTEKIDLDKFCESIPKYIHDLVKKIRENLPKKYFL